MLPLNLRKIAAGLLTSLSLSASATVLMTPTPLDGIDYPSLLTGEYSSQITVPKEVLGFEVGQRTATPEQINQLVTLWASQSDRASIVEYARSYEGRPLHYLIISKPDNLQNLEQIKRNIGQLSRPAALSDEKVRQLIAETPATAWMAYSIHGNESSGADAALALIYHLLASEQQDVTDLLDDMVIIVDPMMNPDGRARFTKNLQQHRGTAPNLDTQSLLHAGTWPWGRTNHYLFDLNRDFYFAVNPESRGRIEAINQWYPLLMIDGHEMGALNTYLFGPPRQPINSHIPDSTHKWGKVFASEQAAAYDEKVWPYYTGEWFESLYPGYSNYAEYRGAIHILYEQARTAEDGVRLLNGEIRTYKESVDHQFVSSLANLATLKQNKQAIFQDFVKNRRDMVSSRGQYANQSWIVLPNDNISRMQDFIALLDLQGIEYYWTESEISVRNATNHLGQKLSKTSVPSGALVIPNRQYEAPLIAAILEFDAQINQAVLKEERQKTLRDGSSVMYDNTAWNLTMTYGLPALQVPAHLDEDLTQNAPDWQQGLQKRDNAIAYLVRGGSDASVAYAARLMEQGVKVRVLNKDGEFNDMAFPRGTVVVYKYDNRIDDAALEALIEKTATETATLAIAISQGLGEEDLPDIGGEYFPLLERPRLALVSQNGINPYDFGSIWHMLDTQLGIRHSHLHNDFISDTDLRSYNVLVIPSRYYGGLSAASLNNLNTWIENGGTLIVNGNSARALAANDDFSQINLLDDVLEDAGDYRLSLQREWLATQESISNQELIDSHTAPADVWYPWNDNEDLEPMDADTLEKWNDWSRHFMPSGAMIAARTDQKHWLTYGVDSELPVLTSNAPLFMVDDNSEAIVRYGVMVENEDAEARMLGWSEVAAGQDLYLRMSGLLWPEAAQRIANSAYMARESKGNGQIIMFANMPNFRGASKGTARLLLNAIVYGPGLGATSTLVP